MKTEIKVAGQAIREEYSDLILKVTKQIDHEKAKKSDLQNIIRAIDTIF